MSSDSLRRIMAEVKEFNTLNECSNTFFHASPLESDLYEWHFTVRGPPDTAFSDGVYHGRILLPAEYPLKPPEIILLTQNGRFEVGKRICLSVTAHHQETWQPSWGIRTILTALVGFMPSKAEGVGALDYPEEDRRRLARKSWNFYCDRCGARPIEQLTVSAAVTTGFPGAKCSTNNHLASASSESFVPVPRLQSPETSLTSDESPAVHTESSSGARESNAAPSSTTSTSPIAQLSSQEPLALKTRMSSSTQVPSSLSVPSSSVISLSGPSTSAEGENINSLSLSSDHRLETNRGATAGHALSNPVGASPTEAVSQGLTATTTSRTVSRNIREPELLFLACAIGVVILAIILRRVFIIALQ